MDAAPKSVPDSNGTAVTPAAATAQPAATQPEPAATAAAANAATSTAAANGASSGRLFQRDYFRRVVTNDSYYFLVPYCIIVFFYLSPDPSIGKSLFRVESRCGAWFQGRYGAW